MEYLYQRVRDVLFDTSTPERKAFAKHLQLVAKALHDIEWVDSGDYGLGDENDAIRACLGGGAVLEALKAMCQEFRALDLPYGSEAYTQAITAINKARGWNE